MSLEASRHATDRRPETYRPNLDTLEVGEVLDTGRDRLWSARRLLVDPLAVESMCEALDRQRKDGSSLAVVRPGEVLDLVIENEADDWSRNKGEIAAQPSLFFSVEAAARENSVPFPLSLSLLCAVQGSQAIDRRLGTRPGVPQLELS